MFETLKKKIKNSKIKISKNAIKNMLFDAMPTVTKETIEENFEKLDIFSEKFHQHL